MSIRVGDNIIAGGGMPINKSALYLFDFKWSDHLVNQQEWLRADTFTWHDGTVYQNAYQHLVEEWNEVGDNPETEIINGVQIWYRLAPDGHKICAANQEASVGQIFLDTGVAWYYILDTENQRFKLPRTEFGFVGVRGNVGDYVEPGLPNITSGNAGVMSWYNDNPTWTQGALQKTVDIAAALGNSGSWTYTGPANFDASRSSSIYGNSTTVQPSATQMYLYFYVGEFTQTATQNTAGLNAELFNSKADLSMFQVVTALPANPNPDVFYFVIAQ